jgi:hypothetical protein
MVRRGAVIATILAAAPHLIAGQAKPPAGTPIVYNITVKADAIYTGTIELATEKDAVSGSLQITAPTPITGKVAGTTKAGVMSAC